jgi:hypothetical protein
LVTLTLSLPNVLSCYASDLPVSLSKVMENWTYKPGYPVLQVKRDSDNVVVSQVCENFDKLDSCSEGFVETILECWYSTR